MNRQDKVVSKETAIALHKAGIEVETESYWCLLPSGEWELLEKYNDIIFYKNRSYGFFINSDVKEIYPAYDTDELYNILPKEIDIDNITHGLFTIYLNALKLWCCGYIKYETILNGIPTIYEGLQSKKELKEALASLVLWCSKEGYLEVEK